MYEPTGFSLEIFKNRYAYSPKESWMDATRRWAAAAAAAERPEVQGEWTDTFAHIIQQGLFFPGGRICYSANRPKGQMLNCFVIPVSSDSREGWAQVVGETLIISGTGGGVGTNYSPVRPRGMPISSQAGVATGAVSLMDITNAVGEVIRAGGGRRTALMMCLDIDHPDIPIFLEKKLDLSQLTNANISVVFQDDPTHFFHKVAQDDLHEFVWQGRVIGAMPARELWTKMLYNAVQCGEPGILNGYLANKSNNIAYYRTLVSTNPCGEIWLEPYGCCDLGALVLPRFIDFKTKQLNRKLLASVIKYAVRFLDNILDTTAYPLKAIEENCKTVRRIGLGIMGLHDALIRLGIRYTSDQAKEWTDMVFSFIKKKAYEASIFLAVEKGQFPALNRLKFVESGFCRTALSEGMRERIVHYGIRNCALLTVAPTGTTSMVAGVSPSLEPIPAVAYYRTYRDGEVLKKERVEHPLFTELKSTPAADLFESALEIHPRHHLEMQKICQRHVDNAISKTINLPHGFSADSLDILLREYLPYLKGVTVYRDGSRGNSPIEFLSVEKALQDTCPSGACDL